MHRLTILTALLTLATLTAPALAAQALLPMPKLQFFNNNGAPLAGGKIYTCQPGTTCGPGSTTLKSTYTDSTGWLTNANPVILDSAGRAPIWGTGFYKEAVYDSYGAMLYTQDNVNAGPTDPTAAHLAASNTFTQPLAAPNVPMAYTIGSPGFANLSSAKVAIGSVQATVYVPVNTVTNTLTIPSNIELIPMNGMVITVSVGNTLTYLGSSQRWPDAQIFSGAVTGLKYVLDSWFPTAQSGLNAVAGGVYHVTHNRTEFAPWVVPKYTTIQGTGKAGVKVTFTNTGDGIQSTWPINSSTPAYVTVKDIWLYNSNASNTGGGFVDVGGSFIKVENVLVQGFKYGVIFDQSELSDIDLCDFETQLLAGVWLVNGAGHTAGASGGFTNRISITRNQFGGAYGTGYGIIDDGGNAHALRDNNFNGLITHGRFAGIAGLSITGGEYESASGPILEFDSTAYSGVSSGASISVSIGGGAELVPTAGQSCIKINSITTLSLDNVYLGNSTAVKITGGVNAAYIHADHLYNGGGGATFDSVPTINYDMSGSVAILPGALLTGRLQQKIVSLVYSPSITIDASKGNFFTLSVTNGVAFALNNITNPLPGQEITIAIYNNSGGAMGAITWGSASNYRMTTWTNPANGYLRTITFRYVASNWVQTSVSPSDIAQ